MRCPQVPPFVLAWPRMADQPTRPVVVARVGELGPGQTKTFVLRCGARQVEAFLVNFRGRLHAYVNRCQHVPMTMDWIENRFLNEDGTYIQCATHGACYLPDSGECVYGPPLGKFLVRVPLTVRDGEVLAFCPEEEVAADLSRAKP
jgi:nitrite reductase/ring-hydroxylating ferredoxin subunit